VEYRSVLALGLWMVSSWVFAIQPTVLRDLPYAEAEGNTLLMDLYLPGNTDADIREGDRQGVPCVIFVHGGGWKGGDKKSAKQNAAWLVEHGFAVASINYRLTDVARWPAQINDCYEAVRWVRSHAREHGIDPIVLAPLELLLVPTWLLSWVHVSIRVRNQYPVVCRLFVIGSAHQI